MSIVTQTFHNIECDRCGELIDPEYWYEEEYFLESVMQECNWKQIDGKHYCPECYEIDDNDNYVIKENHDTDN